MDYYCRTDVNSSVASKCLTKEVPITSSIDTTTVGIAFAACVLENENNAIMCGLKSFKQANVKDVSEKLFIPKCGFNKKTDDSTSFIAIMALNLKTDKQKSVPRYSVIYNK